RLIAARGKTWRKACRKILPYAATTRRSGARARTSSMKAASRRGGWNSFSPRERAASLTGEDAQERPRPDGWSGLVSAPTAHRAIFCRDGTAREGVPAKRTRIRLQLLLR